MGIRGETRCGPSIFYIIWAELFSRCEENNTLTFGLLQQLFLLTF